MLNLFIIFFDLKIYILLAHFGHWFYILDISKVRALWTFNSFDLILSWDISLQIVNNKARIGGTVHIHTYHTMLGNNCWMFSSYINVRIWQWFGIRFILSHFIPQILLFWWSKVYIAMLLWVKILLAPSDNRPTTIECIEYKPYMFINHLIVLVPNQTFSQLHYLRTLSNNVLVVLIIRITLEQ